MSIVLKALGDVFRRALCAGAAGSGNGASACTTTTAAGSGQRRKRLHYDYSGKESVIRVRAAEALDAAPAERGGCCEI